MCIFGWRKQFCSKKSSQKRSCQHTNKGVSNALMQAFHCWHCVGGSGVSTMGRLVPNFGEGGSMGFWLILVEVFFFNWYTFFCLPDKANTPARNFWIWQKIGLDPLVLFSVKPLKQKMWRWGDNWCSNWNQSTYTCTQIKMKYAWGGRGQGSKAGFDSKGLIGSVTSHSGPRIFSNRFLKEVVK